MTNPCAAQDCSGAISSHDSSAGLRLCRTCLHQLLEHLNAIPQLYQACEEVLEFRGQRGGQRVSGWRPTGIRLNEAAVAVRSDMLEILTAWTAMVIEARRIRGPQDRSVAELVRILRPNALWLTAHEAAGDLAGELSDIVRRADEVLAPESARRLTLGHCTEAGCGRDVYAKSEAGGCQVACAGGHPVPPHRWLKLARSNELPDRGEQAVVIAERAG